MDELTDMDLAVIRIALQTEIRESTKADYIAQLSEAYEKIVDECARRHIIFAAETA